MEKIMQAQEELKDHGIDGWLIYDFGTRNPLANDFLEIPRDAHVSRRFFYFIPRSGSPVKIVHQIEPHVLDHLPGDVHTYFKWNELEEVLGHVLKSASCVAMEYSPNNSVPSISMVDAGTIEMVKYCNVDVVSSSPFLGHFTSSWNEKMLESHREAVTALHESLAIAWESAKVGVSEYELQQVLMCEFEARGAVTEGLPICAINENSANPHYCPTKANTKHLAEGDFLLLDLWCKKRGGVFADICRVGVFAPHPTKRQEEVFNIVLEAQTAAIDFIKRRFEKGEIVKGFEVDEIARDVVTESGFGKHFIHRLGHNIHTNVHGPGAHLDSLETFDDRPLIPGTCVSIEPGIYLPGEFGVRLETDVFIHENGAVEVTAGIQDKIEVLI